MSPCLILRICGLEKASDVAKALGGNAHHVKTDILQLEEIENLVKEAAEFGGGKIHILVNNAGFTWDSVIHKVSTPASKLQSSLI